MKSTSQEELELQRNRLEILKMSGKAPMTHNADTPDENLYLWQYELEFYKQLRRRERWYALGAVCGVLSLILTILFHWQLIVSWL